jgi:ParB family chromosome partitioning protein
LSRTAPAAEPAAEPPRSEAAEGQDAAADEHYTIPYQDYVGTTQRPSPPAEPQAASEPGARPAERAAAEPPAEPSAPGSSSPPPAEQPGEEHGEPAAEDASAEPGPIRVEVGRIDRNPFQPRQDFDRAEIQSLSDSLRAHGLLQPLVVRRQDDRYQLIAGERRFQAAMKAGWTEVPVHVVEADDRELAELAIVENLHRKDLNPLEKAASFQRYLQRYGATQEELAARLKLDRSTIANLIRLLELPEAVREAIRRGEITQGHARALLPLGDEREQVAFCGRIRQEGLSVRRTEALVQEAIEEADAEPLGVVGIDGAASRPRRPKSDHVASLEQELRIALGTNVKITHTSRGRGKVVIHFSSHQEFERIRRHLTGDDLPMPESHVG